MSATTSSACYKGRPNSIIYSYSTFRLGTKHQPFCCCCCANLHLGPFWTKTAVLMISEPILCLCWWSVCADIDVAVTMILGLITKPETDISPPPISSGASCCEWEREVNDSCRRIAECQLGWLFFKTDTVQFFFSSQWCWTCHSLLLCCTPLHLGFLMHLSSITLCSASAALCFRNKQMQQRSLNTSAN